MSKKICLLSFILVSINLYSLDLSLFFNIGSVGGEFISGVKGVNGYSALPSVYLFDRDSNIGLNIDSPSFSYGDYYDYSNLFRTKLYWSPIIENDQIILGPFVDYSLGYDNLDHGNSYDMKSRVGVKYSMFHTIFENEALSGFKMKVIDLEAGYSIIDNQFHISCNTDLIVVFVGLFYLIVE